MGDAESFEDSELRKMLDRLIQRMQEEGFIRISPPDPNLTAAGDPDAEGPGDVGTPRSMKFELTDKSIDFLGFKALRGLLGGLGKASFGQHETKELSTGVEVVGSSKPYEFGDTLNLDVSTTLLSAVGRNGIGVPIDLSYGDLHVHQSEYRSSCATVLMLDCSHSMILYGEDRFTPAKRVTLALSHLIATQFPGDRLHLVLFHDSAEEVPLSRLPAVRVGPFHTNTAEGLRLAQEILLRERSDMRQIIMITDGKPSALDARGRADLQEPLRPRSADHRSDFQAGRGMPPQGDRDQYLHAGARLFPRRLRPESDGDRPGQSLLHDTRLTRAVRAHGLREEEDEADSLIGARLALRACGGPAQPLRARARAGSPPLLCVLSCVSRYHEISFSQPRAIAMSNHWQGEERRAHPRVSLKGEAPARVVAGIVVDLSLSGALLEVGATLPTKSRYTVRLEQDGGLPLELAGEVVRSYVHGFEKDEKGLPAVKYRAAIQFLDLTPETKDDLERLLAPGLLS